MGDRGRVEIERVCGLCPTCRRVERRPEFVGHPRINCARLAMLKSQLVPGMSISVEDCDIYEEREQ